jgi:hypothetical protein
MCSRLAFKVFHDVQEPIVHVRLLVELNLDLVKIAEGILEFTKNQNPSHVETSTSTGRTCYSCRMTNSHSRWAAVLEVFHQDQKTLGVQRPFPH